MVISKPPSPPKQKPSSQVSGFNSDSTFSHLQFLQKALFRIGMERIVPNRHSRRNSTGNLTFKRTGYNEILSRYLQPPFPSCHDNCKQPFLDLPLEFKPATPPPIEKPSSTTSKKLSTPPPIPKPSTKDVKINKTSLLKHQIKPAPNESKSQDFKSKGDDQDDPFYQPPSRLTRRYSEVIIPTTGLGDVLDSPARSGKTINNKNEPRKNSKPPPNSVKTAVKTPENNGKVSKKVQPLKAQLGSTVDQGSRKSKPVKPSGEVVQEKKTDKADKIQSRTSVGSRNEERGSGNGQNGAQISSSSKKNETLQRDGQKNGITALEIKKTEKKIQIPQKDEQKNGIAASEVEKTENKIQIQIPTSGSSRNEERVSENGDANGCQIYSSSKEDETLQRDGEKNGITSLEVKKTENRIQSPASGNGQYGLQIFSSSKKDETQQKDGQKNSITLTPLEIKKTEKPTRLRRLATENGICSPRKSKFNQGKIVDSEPGSSSPRKHKFGIGKVVDENKNSPDNMTGLRRLSSDSVLHTSEIHSVNVDLKRCQVKTNKTHVGLNNIIEETASKLIRTRKSKVKALVGAFEMISKPKD